MYDIRVLEKMHCTNEEKKEFLPLLDQLTSLCETARKDGVLALSAAQKTLTPPLLKKGIQLVTDGVMPDYVEEILYNHAICGGAEGKELFRNILIAKGVMEIQNGRNPVIYRDILLSLFGSDFIG